MESNKLVPVFIALAISTILIGSVLVPVIDDAINDEFKTVVNNEFTYYRSMADGDTIIVSDATATTFTVNGESASVPTGTASQVITSDSLVFSMNREKSTHTVYVLIDGVPYQYVATMVNLTVSKDKIIGTVTTADNTVSINVPITWAFTYSTGASDWVQYNAYGNRSIAINDIDQLYGANWISTTSGFFAFHGDNLKVNGIVNDTIVFNPEKQSGYADYYILTYTSDGDNTSFVVDNSGEDYTVHPYYLITPKSIMVTEEKDAGTVAILAAIPIIVILSLLVTAASVIRGRY